MLKVFPPFPLNWGKFSEPGKKGKVPKRIKENERRQREKRSILRKEREARRRDHRPKPGGESLGFQKKRRGASSDSEEGEEEKKRQSRIAEEEEYERVVLVTNTNRDDSIIEARTVDEALAHMTIADNLPVDKHPEKRLKASFKAFEEAELRRLKEEKPGLTHTQYKDLIWKLWKKSPDNPLNQYLGMDMYANSLLKYLLLFASMSFFLCPSFPD
nr:coiled-coil domain-containing protein 124-like [Ipomoea batatas]